MKIEKIAIKEIKPNKNNAKLHPQWQLDQIKESIVQFGNNDPIAIDENNVVIEGHGRLMALEQLGYEEAEIIRLEHLTEEQKSAYILAHNKLTMNTDFDLTILEEELEKIESIDMEDFGFDLSDEYENFIDKFQEKKTTDDCYTPQNVYDAVKEYVVKKYNLGGREIIRPFYPGGDYQNYKYPENCIVIDNPPFSIITSICDWYNENGIDFFLFAPYLTNFGARANHILTDVTTTYENGAKVNTAFLTNLGDVFIESNPELQKIIEEENRKNIREEKPEVAKYKYPKEVITSTKIGYLAKWGVKVELKENECMFFRALDKQKENGKGIFGNGFLVSKAAAERLAAAEIQAEKNKEIQAEKEIVWELSEREKAIVDNLGVK
nr:MAG TPA: ParB protein [Caudoviricetes sp.]